jgi:membrane-associated protease RseP (regulator of RpoE activity)
MLGVMNLLPIPALDGGHVMFLLYEIISGKNQEVTNSRECTNGWFRITYNTITLQALDGNDILQGNGKKSKKIILLAQNKLPYLCTALHLT